LSMLRSEGDSLLAAGYYKGIDARQDGIGIRGPADTGFSRWFDFVEVSEPFSCPAPSTVDARCRPQWRDWMVENPSPNASPDLGMAILDASVPVDATSSPSDAGSGATGVGLAARDAGTLATKPSDPGGCAIPKGQSHHASRLGGLLAVLGTLLLAWRRRPRVARPEPCSRAR